MTITEEYAKDLIAVARATVSGTEEAEDIAQDAYIKLMELDRAGRVATRFVAFKMIEVIAHQQAANLHNKDKRRREIEQEHGKSINRNLTGQSAEHMSAAPDEIIISEEVRNRLLDLSPLVYATAHSHYIDGRTVLQLAMDYACTEAVIYKRLQRARDIITGEQ
jgi:RNA polymerase sigma factor (sigma-70 family)